MSKKQSLILLETTDAKQHSIEAGGKLQRFCHKGINTGTSSLDRLSPISYDCLKFFLSVDIAWIPGPHLKPPKETATNSSWEVMTASDGFNSFFSLTLEKELSRRKQDGRRKKVILFERRNKDTPSISRKLSVSSLP